MKINQRANVAKKGYLVISMVLILLGVLFVMEPDFGAQMICHVLGGCLMVFGMFKIVGYFSNDLYRLAFQFDLTLGLMMLIAGAVLIFSSKELLYVTCLIIGFFVAMDALPKIKIALDAKKFGISKWWLILTGAVITGFIGILVMIRPGESLRLVMVLMGVCLITEGILNLITMLTAVEIRENQIYE